MDRLGTALEVGTVAALAVHNVAVNHVFPEPLDDVFSLAGAAALTAGARMNGFAWDELGMQPEAFARGFKVGLAGAAVSALTIAALSRHPRTRLFFEDERAMDVGRAEILYHSTFRIPAATALVEEVLFRGVLEGTLARRRSPRAAAVASSVLFGLWHVLPTLRTHRGNPASVELTSGGPGRAVGITVAATSVAGVLLLWLRRSSGSVLAPVIAHAAINVSAYLHALAVTKGTVR